VLVNHTNVAIEKALKGDTSADVLFKPGDVVSIRRLAGWRDIGASVDDQRRSNMPAATEFKMEKVLPGC
jgi:hypothetical protein